MRDRRTIGQWPPTVGDLVIRTLADGERCPVGWTETITTPRSAWRIWTGHETGIGDADAAWAVSPT